LTVPYFWEHMSPSPVVVVIPHSRVTFQLPQGPTCTGMRKLKLRWAAVEPGEHSRVGVGGWLEELEVEVEVQKKVFKKRRKETKKAIADMKWKTSGLTFALR